MLNWIIGWSLRNRFLVLLATPGLAAGTPTLRVNVAPPRARLVKPAHAQVNEHHAPDLIWVKFRDELPVRLRQGVLSDLDSGALDAAQDLLAAHAGDLLEEIRVWRHRDNGLGQAHRPASRLRSRSPNSRTLESLWRADMFLAKSS